MLNLRLVSLPLAVASLLLSGAAAAQDDASPAPQRGGPGSGVCHADVQRFCDEAKGKPRGVSSCLRSHLEELSPACREQVSRRSQRRQQRAARLQAACEGEMERFCAGSEPGRGLKACLRQNQAELSETCRAALPKRGRKDRRGGGPPPADPAP